MHRILRICSVGFFRSPFVHSVNSVRIRFFDRMNRILRIVFAGFRTTRLHFVNSVQKISHARKNAWLRYWQSAFGPRTSLRRHYPHQVQGVRLRRLSHSAPPHFHAKLRLEEPKSTRQSTLRALCSELLTPSSELISPLSHSYGRSPSKRPFPASRRTRRCRCRKHLCHQPCLQLSPCKS